jgi:hypothetical protein
MAKAAAKARTVPVLVYESQLVSVIKTYSLLRIAIHIVLTLAQIDKKRVDTFAIINQTNKINQHIITITHHHP